MYQPYQIERREEPRARRDIRGRRARIERQAEFARYPEAFDTVRRVGGYDNEQEAM